ncbi:hypothetical protein PR202_gb26199 [Eleusine coracana subsp. coracana]|uniref:Protein FAR1-RELATED SEQUENCE n=1 Tax=Eleusine coracana subsp. coracana TaxID=191504 RepID=A0AAV5FR79_ELECO|nr:hypothetical protein PR202_gb26199 [Eleusine coracana subsp. coracana]
MVGHCSCMLFETHGIPCRHIIYVLRAAKQNELPRHYVLKRWTKNCKKEVVYDADENLLEEKGRTSMDTGVKMLASDMRKEMEDIFQQAGSCMHTMKIINSKFQKFVDEVKLEFPTNQPSRFEELEHFTGCTIPSQVNICRQLIIALRVESKESGDTQIREVVTRRKRRLRKRKMKGLHVCAGHAKS